MSDGLTIESFAASLAQADTPEQPAKADSDPVVDALLAGEDLPLGDAEETEGEAQADPEATEQQSEQPPADSDPAPEPVHKWTTANGEAIEATESELRAGYLRNQDYTQKTQQVAEMARQSVAQVQQQLAATKQFQDGLMYVGGLKAQIQALQSQNLPTADLQVQLMRAEQQLGGAWNQITTSIDQQTASQQHQAVSASEQHLAQRFNGITREQVQGAFESIVKLGTTQREIDLIRTNPRIAELAIYAGKWLDLQAKKPEVTNEVRKLPPPTTAPRAAAPSSKTDAAVKAINSRRTFSTNEFAQLLKATR